MEYAALKSHLLWWKCCSDSTVQSVSKPIKTNSGLKIELEERNLCFIPRKTDGFRTAMVDDTTSKLLA
jgi:hypothetical protein